ncbi:DUF3397 domain-containing protein [Marinicrinis lubricantis]|uniref:DUF3397 domain-containing protein n=1 Tax=Marinicrinis lubricantis TaxID=2086470 RepID=A0ABW1IUY7_9BACL
MEFIVNIVVFLAMFPFIPFICAWYIAKRLWNNQKKAVSLAMDVTTAFLAISVSGLYDTLIGTEIQGIYILLLFMVLAIGLVGGAQSRLKGKVNLQRIIRAVWRIGFLLLSVFYILFMLAAFIQSVRVI